MVRHRLGGSDLVRAREHWRHGGGERAKGLCLNCLPPLARHHPLTVEAAQWLNQRAFRKLGQHLRNDTQATGVRHIVWRLRDDLVDLYRLVDRIDKTSIRTTGEDRSVLDLLHAIRIAAIIDSLVLICQTPTLAESNQYSNADILALGLKLDFATATTIIQSAFTTGLAANETDDLVEPEDYSVSNSGNYSVIEEQVLKPLAHNQHIIHTITQMVSAHYGAHG